MVAIGVMLVMMVAIPVSAVILPVAMFAEGMVIVPVSARIPLIAIAIFVVVAFMVATRKDNCRTSELNSHGYLGLRFRR
jgi:hypothetical protein